MQSRLQFCSDKTAFIYNFIFAFEFKISLETIFRICQILFQGPVL